MLDHLGRGKEFLQTIMKLGTMASEVRSRRSHYHANGWVLKYVQGSPHRQISVYLYKRRLRSE